MTTRTRQIAGCLLMAGAWMASAARVEACPICFRAEESATTDGIIAAVWVLAGVTVVVLGAIGVWIRGTGLFSTDPAQNTPVPKP